MWSALWILSLFFWIIKQTRNCRNELQKAAAIKIVIPQLADEDLLVFFLPLIFCVLYSFIFLLLIDIIFLWSCSLMSFLYCLLNFYFCFLCCSLILILVLLLTVFFFPFCVVYRLLHFLLLTDYQSVCWQSVQRAPDTATILWLLKKSKKN